MPKSRNPDAYPPVYYRLFEAALSSEHGHSIENLTREDAIYLRHDLYAFRQALYNSTPDFAKKFMELKIFLTDREGLWEVLIQHPDHGRLGQAIAESLLNIKEEPIDLPDINFNLENPSEETEVEEDNATALTLRRLGLLR